MGSELISKATRNEFRETLVGFVLREIEMIFENAGIEARAILQPHVTGQRRIAVEQYYSSIDFCSPLDVRKAVCAFEEVIERLQQTKGNLWAAQNPSKEKINVLLRRMERDGFRYENGRFTLDPLARRAIQAPSLIALTETSLIEQIERAREKIDGGDHPGAIASAYTLIEGFLKELLRRTGVSFSEDEGDIRQLYKLAAQPLNLNPKGETLESHLKAILQGLGSQVSGLYELANKASDRHVRRYNPARHHAKLAVNDAFTLCEFLLDSFEYQQKKKQQKQAM
jgi:hypothetical protein